MEKPKESFASFVVVGSVSFFVSFFLISLRDEIRNEKQKRDLENTNTIGIYDNEEIYDKVELREDGTLVAIREAAETNVNGTIVYSAPNGYTLCDDGTCFKVIGEVGKSVALIDDGQCDITLDPVQGDDGRLICPVNSDEYYLGEDGKYHRIVFVAVESGFLVYNSLGDIVDIIRASQDLTLKLNK